MWPRCWWGRLGTQRVAMLRGRAHTYESGDCTGMNAALRSLKAWGVKVLVLTNASGSLRAHMPAGSLMLITDHINAPQRSPLIGEHGSERFVDMSHAYDPELRAHAMKVAQRSQLALGQGVYVWALGPQFETPAEIRMFAAWGGADLVGMSTVPEAIAARHAGLRVMGPGADDQYGRRAVRRGADACADLAAGQGLGRGVRHVFSPRWWRA